jgi:type II secretory pathway component PulC
MVCSGTFVKALTHDRAVLDHHGADSRVGMGAVSGRELKRPLQPGTVEQIHLVPRPVAFRTAR